MSKYIFNNYTQKECQKELSLIDQVIDIIVDGTSFIYGAEMGSAKNRIIWKKYNLYADNDKWHLSSCELDKVLCGFLIYELNKEKRTLIVNDLHIHRRFRHNPVIMKGLLFNGIVKNKDHFDTIIGYIHKDNKESQSNFFKHASRVDKLENGNYKFEIKKDDLKL